MAEAQKGIQATLFDYFQDTEYFDLQQAQELILEHEQRDVNVPSIRARIYEGIDKGLFERVGKGLYTVTRKDEQGRENTCLLINGDGRDLSMFADASLDGIITDHPYSLKNSLKGGNRDFANYELFQYNDEDFKEKQRVLKAGCFAVEFLPEENGDNYQYLFQVKEMARKAGLEYYATVPWVKTGFVANTGRKAKNTENVVFFSNGRARDLRPDAKKNRQYENNHEIVTFKKYIPGANAVSYIQGSGIGHSSESRIEPIDADLRLFVSKDDVQRVKDLLENVFENEILMDQYEVSPLDKDNGGTFSTEEIFDMSAREYLLRRLAHAGISFVDLSHGKEDILEAQTQYVVNPTNLVGPMGAGLAKAFKEKYPSMAEEYQFSCKSRELAGYGVNVPGHPARPGQIIITPERPIFPGDLWTAPTGEKAPAPQRILCFPTKRDWKDPSDLSLIEEGLKTFVHEYKDKHIKSITFPKLGCGLGGLDWENQVKPLMRKYLADLPDVDVLICGDTLHEYKKEFFMSGAAGMLPTAFEVTPVGKKDKIHQAEKPVELLRQILRFVTKEDELVLDQFAGSGVLGEAALLEHRDSVLIEKDAEAFQKLTERLQALGNIQALIPAAQAFAAVGADALIAKDAFERTGDRQIITDFSQNHEVELQVLYDGACEIKMLTDDVQLQEAVSQAMAAIGEMDPKAAVKNAAQEMNDNAPTGVPSVPDTLTQNIKSLECSSRGDQRFSALYAMVTIKGKEKSIEEWYQEAKRNVDGKKAGKGKAFDHIVDPFTGDKLPASEASSLYQGLWVTYLTLHPELVEYASKFDSFTDMFRSEKTVNCQADVIAAYIKDKDSFVGKVRQSLWYRNTAENRAGKKPTLDSMLKDADTRQQEQKQEQMTLFHSHPNYRG